MDSVVYLITAQGLNFYVILFYITLDKEEGYYLIFSGSPVLYLLLMFGKKRA